MEPQRDAQQEARGREQVAISVTLVDRLALAYQLWIGSPRCAHGSVRAQVLMYASYLAILCVKIVEKLALGTIRFSSRCRRGMTVLLDSRGKLSTLDSLPVATAIKLLAHLRSRKPNHRQRNGASA